MRKPSNSILYASLILIFIIGGGILINLVRVELNRYFDSKECSGTIIFSELSEPIRLRQDTFTRRYDCSQIISSNSNSGIIIDVLRDDLSDQLSLQKTCKQRTGKIIEGYCYDNEFRQYKNSDNLIIRIASLVGIFIFAGKLLYNHQQRKKKISS